MDCCINQMTATSELASKAKVSDEEARKWYSDHSKDYEKSEDSDPIILLWWRWWVIFETVRFPLPVDLHQYCVVCVVPLRPRT